MKAREHWDSWSQGALQNAIKIDAPEPDPISQAILYAYGTIANLERKQTELEQALELANAIGGGFSSALMLAEAKLEKYEGVDI